MSATVFLLMRAELERHAAHRDHGGLPVGKLVERIEKVLRRPSPPHGRMMATMLTGIAQFERDLLSERVKSGLAAARARGKKLGRQLGQRPNQTGSPRRCSMPSTAGGATVGLPATARVSTADQSCERQIARAHRLC